MTLIWLLNLIFDHNAGFLDKMFLLFYRLIMLGPLGTMVATLNASKNYGTAAQVATDTNWVYTVESDPNYSLVFTLSFIGSMLSFIYQFMELDSLTKAYNEKAAYKVYVDTTINSCEIKNELV